MNSIDTTNDYKLDKQAGTVSVGWSLAEYASSCSNAIDTEALKWPIAKKVVFSDGYEAQISCGYVGNKSKYLSMMWVQDIPSSDDISIESIRKATHLISIEPGVHAPEWDHTFDKCTTLGNIPKEKGGGAPSIPPINNNDTDLSFDAPILLWEFSASPLSDREMLYTIATVDGHTEKQQHSTYAYASVSDAWVTSILKNENKGRVIATAPTTNNRVRSYNVYPTCDRISVVPVDNSNNNKGDNSTDADNTATKSVVRIEHLMTTKIGGSIPAFCFNNVFFPALMKAYQEEASRYRAYVEKLALKLEKGKE